MQSEPRGGKSAKRTGTCRSQGVDLLEDNDLDGVWSLGSIELEAVSVIHDAVLCGPVWVQEV